MWVREKVLVSGRVETIPSPTVTDGERTYFAESDHWQLLVDLPKLIVAARVELELEYLGQTRLVIYHEEEGV